jgi:hypothetical protein
VPGHKVLPLFGVVLLGATLLGAGSLGCDPLSPQVFVASAWNESDACLEASGVVDVYDEDAPKACNDTARCWRSPEDEIYVTTACEAPIGWELLDRGDDPRCQAALDAWKLGKDGRCDA